MGGLILFPQTRLKQARKRKGNDSTDDGKYVTEAQRQINGLDNKRRLYPIVRGGILHLANDCETKLEANTPSTFSWLKSLLKRKSTPYRARSELSELAQLLKQFEGQAQPQMTYPIRRARQQQVNTNMNGEHTLTHRDLAQAYDLLPECFGESGSKDTQAKAIYCGQLIHYFQTIYSIPLPQYLNHLLAALKTLDAYEVSPIYGELAPKLQTKLTNLREVIVTWQNNYPNENRLELLLSDLNSKINQPKQFHSTLNNILEIINDNQQSQNFKDHLRSCDIGQRLNHIVAQRIRSCTLPTELAQKLQATNAQLLSYTHQKPNSSIFKATTNVYICFAGFTYLPNSQQTTTLHNSIHKLLTDTHHRHLLRAASDYEVTLRLTVENHQKHFEKKVATFNGKVKSFVPGTSAYESRQQFARAVQQYSAFKALMDLAKQSTPSGLNRTQKESTSTRHSAHKTVKPLFFQPPRIPLTIEDMIDSETSCARSVAAMQ